MGGGYSIQSGYADVQRTGIRIGTAAIEQELDLDNSCDDIVAMSSPSCCLLISVTLAVRALLGKYLVRLCWLLIEQTQG